MGTTSTPERKWLAHDRYRRILVLTHWVHFRKKTSRQWPTQLELSAIRVVCSLILACFRLSAPHPVSEAPRRQCQGRRDSVFLYMGYGTGFGNRDNDVTAADGPGRRNGSCRAIMGCANALESGITQQAGSVAAKQEIGSSPTCRAAASRADAPALWRRAISLIWGRASWLCRSSSPWRRRRTGVRRKGVLGQLKAEYRR